MTSIKSIQIGEDTYDFNKLQFDNAVVEVVGDAINNFANKLQFGRHVDDSNSENLLVVGNGSGEDAKSNALELTYNGELKVQTEVLVGEHRLTEKFDKSDLAEKNDIYDMLGVVTTKYFLTNDSVVEFDDTEIVENSEYKTLVTRIEIGNQVTSINNKAFYDFSNLKSITIPDGVTKIENSAFFHCAALSSVIIPVGVTSIATSVFQGCFNLSSVTIPIGVTSIGNSAFSGCYKLGSITIPNGVTSIGTLAFEKCSVLKNVTIPDSVTSIGRSAFGCPTSGTLYCIKSWYDNLSSSNKTNLGNLTNWTKVYI